MFYERPLRSYSRGVLGGATATAEEIRAASWDSMRLVENTTARMVALERAYDARNDAIKRATGQVLPNPMRDFADIGQDPRDLYYPRPDRPAFDPHADYQRRLEELARQYPEQAGIIAASRPVIQDAQRLAAAAEGRFEDVWAHSDGSFHAWANRLGAAFGATLTDPVNVVISLLGPGGQAGSGAKGVLWAGVKAAAANATAETVMQPLVQDWRRAAGLDFGLDVAATNVAAAGLFGFGLDVGGRSIMRGAWRLIGRPSSEAAGDSVAAETPSGLSSSRDSIARLEEAARAAGEDSPLRRAADLDPVALREVAQATGATADPATRGALAEMETQELFRGMKPEQLDDGEHLRQLATAIRHASGEPGAPPPGDALIVAPARPDTPDLSNARDVRIGETETVEGKPVYFRALDPAGIVTDPETFQFKSGGDAAGVTERLRSVKRWDPISAGKAIVYERANGELVIADGHQRLGLSRRLSAEGQQARLHAYVFREADGWSAADVRAHAALKNMRELSGTSIDMAKVMRERPDLIDGSLPLSDGKLREAAMLAKLSDEAFDAVVAGRLPASFAALIGDHAGEPARHIGLLNELAAADLANPAQARFYLAQLLVLPTTVERQMTLFGEEAITRTLMAERSRVLDAALRSLKSDERIFGLLDREAGRIAESGNVLAREANAARARNAAELGELIEKLATAKGVVATLLNDAAIAVSRGLAATQASRAFVRRIGDILDKEGINGLLKDLEEAAPEGGRLDDPTGAEAKAQSDAMEHDADQGVMFALSPAAKADWRKELQDFLESGHRSAWIDGEGFKIYLRQARRPDPASGELMRMLDIASVEAQPTGAGTFKDVLAEAKTIAAQNGFDALYVENVLTDQFADFFRRAGWIEEERFFAGDAPSFMLPLAKASGDEQPRMPLVPPLRAATLTARAAERMPEIRAAIDKAMNTMLPPSWRHELRDVLVYGGRQVEGYADGHERIVYISLAALDPLGRAFEEAGHALRMARLIPEADYEILRAEARRLHVRKQLDIDTRYGELYGERWQGAELEDRLEEEAIMQMIATHARGQSFGEPRSAARRILDRVVKFLRAVAGLLKGRGLRSYDDVFADMVGGRLARPEALPEVIAASRSMTARDVMFAEGGRRPGSIPDLINGAMAEGRLSREEAAEMLDRLQMLEQHYRDNPAQAAEQLAAEVDAAAERRRRLALLADQARRRVQDWVAGYRDERGQPDPARAMVALIEHHGDVAMPAGISSVHGRAQAILGIAHARLEAALYEFRRTWITGRTRNRARLENMVRELFGEATGNTAAAAFARAWTEVAEMLRQRFNAAGGAIGRLERWGLPQHHDPRALLASGYQRWRDFIAPCLDLARMRHHLTGEPMTAADLEASLRWIYDTITTSGWNEREATAQALGLGALANQRGEHRFLHFRNADVWLEYQAEFGGGSDPFAAMMLHLRGMADDIAAMEVLGPNPRAMLTFLQNFVSQQAALRAAGMEAHFPTHTALAAREFREGGSWLTTRGPLSYAREMNNLAENMWQIFRGGVGVVNQRKADLWGAVRNFNVATMLGAAALSGISDLSFQHQARAFAGLAIHRTWGDMLAAFQRNKRAAVRAGLMLDTAVNVLHNEARWAGSMQGPVWSQLLADRVIAWSGLQAWTQAGRHAWGLAVQGELAERAGLAFDALPAPLRRLLQRYGLTAGDWDAIRLDGNGQVRDVDFLSPVHVFHTMEAAGRGGERVAERYLEMILQESEYAVPQGTLRAKAASGQARPRGTNIDELIRSAAQFKMFGFTIALQQGRRIAAEMVTSGLWRGAGLAGALFITTTLYGALAMQLKEISKGRDPRPMDDAKFWGGAILQGGGLGIFGDFFASETNRVGGGLAQTIAGPTVDRLGGLLALSSGNVAQRVRGENTNFGREAVRFLRQNTPGGSLWYLRLAYERMVLDQLQQLADPNARAAFRKRVQNQQRDFGNEYYWRPGELAPNRVPKLHGPRIVPLNRS